MENIDIENRLASLELRFAALEVGADQDTQLMAAAIESTAPPRGRILEGEPVANPDAPCWGCQHALNMQFLNGSEELMIHGVCRYSSDVRNGEWRGDGFGHKSIITDCVVFEQVPE